MKVPVHFLLLAIALAAFPAGAQTPLSIDESIRLALERNPTQQAAREALAAAAAVIDRARADRRPAVDLVAAARSFETYAFLPEGLTPPGGTSTIGPAEDWSLALEGRYNLYDSGLGRARVKVAEATHASKVHELAEARADLTLAVHSAYRAVEAALAAREAAVSRLERSEDHVRLAQRRLEAGASPRADVTRARVERANAQAALAGAEAGVRTAKAALNVLLGARAEEAVTILPAEPPPGAVDSSLEASISAALESRPEILAARERVEAREAEIRLARAVSGFTADLRGRYGVREDELFPSERDYSIGVVLSKSLFDGGREKAEVARARAETGVEEARLAALENEMRREVVDAHARLTEAHARAEAAAVASAEAVEGVRLMRSRYEAGAAPIGELLDAAADLDAAEAASVSARMSVHVALATLAHARGHYAME
jgi:outer membrane protein TolC